MHYRTAKLIVGLLFLAQLLADTKPIHWKLESAIEFPSGPDLPIIFEALEDNNEYVGQFGNGCSLTGAHLFTALLAKIGVLVLECLRRAVLQETFKQVSGGNAHAQ